MKQQSKRDAARTELLRLLQGLEFYRAWRISGIESVKGTVTQEDIDRIVEPGTSFLELFDRSGPLYIQILKDVQEWYSHTYSDLCFLMNAGPEEVSSEIRGFLDDFRVNVGFEFQAEADLVAKTIKKSLKQGRITRESDYFLLKEVENDTSQAFLDRRELDDISKLLRRFENR
jgi:hypothetical protein